MEFFCSAINFLFQVNKGIPTVGIPLIVVQMTPFTCYYVMNICRRRLTEQTLVVLGQRHKI